MAVETTPKLVDQAVEWAHRGALVIPLHNPTKAGCSCADANCPSVGKHPRTPRGLTDASSDPDVIRRWWTMWPDANIGVRTGFEFDVIDLDGGDAIDRWREWTATIGTQPELLGIALSGRTSGGIHLYTHGGGMKTVPSGKRGLPAGVEIKASGGYVVAPGSMHASGTRYSWASEYGKEIIGTTPWREWYNTNLTPIPAPTAGTIYIPPPDSGQDTSYGQGVLRNACERLASAPEGTRWLILVEDAASSVARAIVGGAIVDSGNATAQLQQAARACGLTTAEVNRIPALLREFVTNGATKPLAGDKRDVTGWLASFEPKTPNPDWWGSRPILAHIHAEAKFRLMSPWALLLAVLVKTSAEIDPHVRLPNLMIATSPINLYGCLLGPSGGGKTGTERAAAELRDWQAPTFDFGSTEGLIDMYVEQVPKKEKGDTDADVFANPFEMVPGHPELRMKNRRGLAKTDELATFLGQAGRAGNTIKGAILTAYFAGTIHPAYRHNKGLLPAGQYQLAWLVGAQPNLAWEVIEDKEVGLPQRLLWAQTKDRNAVEDAPKPEGELPWNVPADATRPGVERLIGVPDDIRREVRLARLEAVKSDEEDLSGHRMLTRLRVAAILALIEGRYNIDPEDWHLSDLIVAHSDACIEMVLAERARRTAEAHKATGQAKAAAALAGAEYTAEVVTERAAQVVARYVHKHGQVTRKQVRGAAGRWKRSEGFHLDEVLAYAVEQGWIVAVEREGRGSKTGKKVTDYAPGSSQPTDAK